MKPLCVELFAGMFGWSAGWLELGGRVIGYDIEHLPHHGPVPKGADLILQDVLTIDGRRLKDADLILCSPPCAEFSYLAMPWSRGKQIAAALRGEGDFPAGYKGSRTIKEMTSLFDACFRIQREASEAAGRYIPMVVENVRGAGPWVGKSKANYGSFHLYGDVPAVPHFGDPFPVPHKARKVPGFRFDGSGKTFQTASVQKATKNGGGSWFAIGSPGQKVTGKNPVHDAVKAANVEGYERDHPAAFGWAIPKTSSKSSARKAASARIAKIPERLSRWIARYYHPEHLKERAS